MKNRILVLNQGLSGVNKYIFSQLKNRGWDLTLLEVPFPKKCMLQAMISTLNPNLMQWKQKAKKKLFQLHKSSWTFLQRTKFCQEKLSKLDGKFDVILQISGMFAPTLDYKNLSVPYVTVNDYTMALCKKYPEWASPPSELETWLGLEKELYENARFIFAASENTRNSFINDYGIDGRKVIKVSYGNTLEATAEFSRNFDNKIVLFVGKDFERKGGYILLESFQKVKQVIEDARLIILGADKNFLKIRQSGVEVLGYIKNINDVKSLYERASVFVMPSLCEPFGLVFLEAMEYKLPCIGSTVDAIPEIIDDGKTGYLVPIGDATVLADKIITLLTNKNLSMQMGTAGHNLLKQKFSWDVFGEKMDKCLKECVDV
jgi:glycosyltransferase involved in cell wall biosynthesis